MQDRLTLKLVILIFVLLAFNAIVLTFNINNHVERYVEAQNYFTLPINENRASQSGIASWYDYDFPKGSGNWVTKEKYVAASRFFPRGSILKVCHLIGLTEFEQTGNIEPRCIEVIITDYGPEERTGRIIDLGSLAFSKICHLKSGVCYVEVEK